MKNVYPLHKYTTLNNIKLSVSKAGTEDTIGFQNQENLLKNGATTFKTNFKDIEPEDKRIEWVRDFFRDNPNGNYTWLKVCRSGATSAFVAVSLDKQEKFCLFSPTNKIGQETVKNAIKFSKRDPNTVKIRHLLTNHECPINKESAIECPDYKRFPFMLLPLKCEECDRNDCINKEIINDDSIDGITMTYDKAVNINYIKEMKSNSTASKIFDRISEARNLLFDEIHELQFGKIKGITVFTDYSRKKDKNDYNLNLDKYNSIPDEYKYINAIVARFKDLIEDQRYKIISENLLNEAKKYHFKKHLSESLTNPARYSLYSDLNIAMNERNEVLNGFYNNIKKLTKERKKYNLSMDLIIKLFSMLAVCTNEKISINAVHVKGNIQINISAADTRYTETIKSFISEMENANKRIILTSGTLCSYDYQQLFKEKLNTIKFCENGDPFNTNEKMLVLVDNKTYSTLGKKATLKTELGEIATKIENILDFYGEEDVLIITANKISEIKIKQKLKERNRDKINITYYGSVDLIGVACDARVGVTIGLGNIPTNTYDYITFNKYLSTIMRKEREHCTIFQGLNRVKDSPGIEKSVIIGLYCKTKECADIFTWGYKRKVNIIEDGFGDIRETYVTCDEPLPQPQIKECGSFEEMLIEANNWRPSKYTGEKTAKILMSIEAKKSQTKIISDKKEKPTKQNTRNHLSVQNFKNETLIVHSRYELIRRMNMGKGAFILNKDGKKSIIRDLPLTRDLVENHFNGNVELELFLLNDKSVSGCMALVGIHDENNLMKLCNCLSLINIYAIPEKTNDDEYPFKIWILLEKISGSLIQELGKYIKSLSDVDCDILPKHSLVKTGRKNSDSVTAPLSGRSEIMINGKWVKDFKNLEVKILDIKSSLQVEAQLC